MALPDLTGLNIEDTYPRLVHTDGADYFDGTGSLLDLGQNPRTVVEQVKNVSGIFLPKGTPVHATGSGTSGNLVGIIAADAGDPTKMPATYVLNTDLDDEEEGEAIAVGYIQGVDTRGLIEGEVVYVAVGGGWTQTKPTGSALIQNLGVVTKVGQNGSGVVLGAGRSNDLPNIQSGYTWVGNSNGVPTAVPTSSLIIDPFPYTGSAKVTGSLQVIGNIIGSGILNLNDGSNNVLISPGNTTITAINTTAVGFEALKNLTTGNSNTAIGYRAGLLLTTGTGNILIGNSAGNSITNRSQNIVIGSSANVSSTVDYGIAIGGSALATGGYSIAIGYFSGQGSSGIWNTLCGFNTMRNSSGDNNAVFGGRAMYATSGTGNTIIGQGAMDGGGSNNNNNVAIGTNAFFNGSNNVVIGYNAASTSGTINNKLYIENSNSLTPLIYGEFDNDLVRINGKLFVSNSLDVTGSISASTYYGDGSNLTGINSGSWDGIFTGSAEITGSLTIDGAIYTTLIEAVSGSDGTPSSGASITIKGQDSTPDGGTGGAVYIKGGAGSPQGSGIIYIGNSTGDTNPDNAYNRFLGTVYINAGGPTTGGSLRVDSGGTVRFKITYDNAANTTTWTTDRHLKIVGGDSYTFDNNTTISGSLIVTDTITELSAERFKENIHPLTGSLEKANQLQGVSFNRIGQSEKEIGFIAEQVAVIFPELVNRNENDEITGIQYSRVTAILLESVKELSLKLNEMEARLKLLENK
jgi:hypothetical protein